MRQVRCCYPPSVTWPQHTHAPCHHAHRRARHFIQTLCDRPAEPKHSTITYIKDSATQRTDKFHRRQSGTDAAWPPPSLTPWLHRFIPLSASRYLGRSRVAILPIPTKALEDFVPRTRYGPPTSLRSLPPALRPGRYADPREAPPRCIMPRDGGWEGGQGGETRREASDS